MFIYLSKKIAIPNSTKLNCMAWNKEHGYIACGGTDGLLKCLLLDSSKFEPNYGGKDRAPSYPPSAPTNLTMNQTLEGHSGNIQVITWNETHQKLTSSDQSGLIIVWMLYKGSWYEEMINNRNKSVVRGMAWNSDGQKICIVYEDGAVIVGSVDGNRIWGRELKIGLTGVEWSPDGRMLLFAIHNGEIHAYDNQGNYIMKLNIQVLSESLPSTYYVIGIQWYNGKYGYIEPDVPTLAICYSNGCLQMMRGENDDMPVLLDMGMAAVCFRWNHDGSILAVTGKIVQPGPNKDINLIQFFSPYGEHLRTLKIPGRDVACCDWEGKSLKIAIAADSYIFFGNVRPNYKWAYFENVVVFSYHRPDRSDTTLCFWDTKKEEAYIKHVKSLRSIAAFGRHCVLGTKADDPSAGNGNYTLILCNSLSTAVDTKYIEFDPLYMAMNASHVIACSRDNFLVWSYSSKAKHLPGIMRFRKERLYHIDDTPSGVSEVIQDLDRSYEPAISTDPSADPVTCLAMSDICLVIGRESGTVQRYILPQVALVQRYSLRARPYRIAINCDSSRLSIIDHTGVMTYLDIDTQIIMRRGEVDSTIAKSEAAKAIAEFDRKDVWGMHWASDNPELIAIMEKTRMYIFRGVEPEEPISSHGYICSFKDLEIRVALLDEIMKAPDPPFSAHIQDLEVKSLRDTRNLLDKVGIPEATIFIEENSHPRLWRLLAIKALHALDLPTAESAFVRCSDYPGIMFARKLTTIHHDVVRRAEVAAYFKDLDTAQALYLQVDRRDLAIELREKLGDWRNVVELLKGGPGGTDAQLKAAYIRVGDDCAEKKNWIEARKYYEDGGSLEKLVDCYFNMEDYDALQATANSLPENHALLLTLGQMFATVGMCPSAVDAYVKCNCVKEAVDVCVSLNQWDQAVDLAKRHKFLEIKDLLTKYAEHLLTKNQTMKAIELYRKANKFLEAAKLLYQMAEEESKKRTSPLTVKRIYVLAALAISEHTSSMTLRPKTAALSEKAVLQELHLIDTAWHGAIAHHYLVLAHRQLYLDQVDSALKTALHLREYDNIIDPETIFSIIALASVGNRAFGTCSRALIKLETLEHLTDAKKLEYEELAMTLFTKYPPRDGRTSRSECTNCETMIPDTCSVCLSCGLKFPICTVTGRSLMNPSHVWTCHVCHQSAWDQYIRVRYCCPLCYTPIRL